MDLNKDWHGLPIWAWGGIGAVGLGAIYYLYRRRSAAATPATSTGTASAVPAADTYANQQPGYGPPATTVIPSSNGMGTDQLLQILQDLQGATEGTSGGSSQPSTTPSTPAPSPSVSPQPASGSPQLSATNFGTWSGNTQFFRLPGSNEAQWSFSPSETARIHQQFPNAQWYNSNWNWKVQGAPPSVSV